MNERQSLLQELVEIGPAAAAAIPAIVETLEKATGASRRDALLALASVGCNDPKSADRIAPFLLDKNPQSKSAAVTALARLGVHQPRAAIPYLLDALERDPEARLESSMALARVGAASVDFLRGRLGHSDPEVRLWVLRALGEIGPAAKHAVPDIEKACGDADKRVQDAAAKALKKIRGN